MTDEDLLIRITATKAILAGKPVIRGTRLSVEYILGLLAHGSSTPEILLEYNGLQEEDVQACILFAAHSISNLSFMPLSAETV